MRLSDAPRLPDEGKNRRNAQAHNNSDKEILGNERLAKADFTRGDGCSSARCQ